MVFAGPVFPEWYWGPIFFLVLFSPLIAGLTTALYIAGRHRGWRRRSSLLALSFAVSVGLVLLGGSVWRWLQFERDASRDARRIDFATFLPRGYHAERIVPVVAEHVVALTAGYAGPLYLEQERAGPVDASDPARCEIFVDGPLSTHPARLGPCEPVTSPRGLAALRVDGSPLSATYAVRDGTLVQVRHPASAAHDALALLDRLERVDPGEIDFKR